MKGSIRDYLATIGRRGGLVSRRQLSPEDARSMAKVRATTTVRVNYLIAEVSSVTPTS